MKQDTISASSKEEKSTVGCCYNQRCLFNHSVIAHDVAERLLCANSRLKIKERCTMNDILNVRELRGLDIANRYTIKQENGFWFVPSTSGKSERYKVDLSKQKCSCPDFEIRRQKCKHIFAAEFSFEQDFLSELTTKETVIPQTYLPSRKTYSQDWISYDKAQTSEKSEFQFLLAELCKGISEPSQTHGRPRLPLEDMIFSCVFKVYSTFSLRRFHTDLKEAHGKGFLLRPAHYKSVSRYFGMVLLTPYLKMLIEESSLPLVEIEKHFAVDASGLSTSQGFTWLHAKYTEPRLINKKDWLKIHICCGTKQISFQPLKLQRDTKLILIILKLWLKKLFKTLKWWKFQPIKVICQKLTYKLLLIITPFLILLGKRIAEQPTKKAITCGTNSIIITH